MRDVMDPADFEYSALAINTACRQGNARVIEWWIESGLELKYSESSALAVPAALGHVDVLKVWRKFAVQQVKLDPAMLIRAAQNGAVETLEWWASESSPEKVRLAIDGCILTCRNVRVVEWYLNHGGSVKRWTDTPSSRPHSPATFMQEQRIKKQVYLSYQRLCQRYPKLTIAPLSPTQIKSLAERGCSAFIKLALTKHPPTDASSPYQSTWTT
ncbi:hypothetical protein BCR44DRAFT_1463132 [Catenaria anguillulae PL171]|uniref:Ankyrin repeat-containing domain protein n=1 Tax=Catenaria anguillulae PL171 TaxID=765915 RepID=A0A1Y2HCZ0_9FUNG|nr:hypothetical protein BCR44DRAFT_1463132 [Catenaria anguillulae PL171]